VAESLEQRGKPDAALAWDRRQIRLFFKRWYAETKRRQEWEKHITVIAETAAERAADNGQQIATLQSRLLGMLDWWGRRQDKRRRWSERWERLAQALLVWAVIGMAGGLVAVGSGLWGYVYDRIVSDVAREAGSVRPR